MSDSHISKEDIIQKQIIEAALQLFRQHGLSKVTMDDVAKAVGKGRSSLYYYYKSKEEIFDAVMDAEIIKIITEIEQAVDQQNSVEQKIRAFCETKLNVLQKRRGFFRSVRIGMDTEELLNHTKATEAVSRRYMKQESALLGQILTYGIKKGELRSLGKKEQEGLILILLSGLRGLKNEMAIENNYTLMQPAINILSNMIMHGLKK